MNISLTPHHEQLVKSCLESGAYDSENDVIHEALQFLEQHLNHEKWLKNEAARGFADVVSGNIVRVSNEREFLALAKGELK